MSNEAEAMPDVLVRPRPVSSAKIKNGSPDVSNETGSVSEWSASRTERLK